MSISPPPASYGKLTGQLFLYATGRAAFESSPTEIHTPSLEAHVFCPNKVILLGGLSDGMMPVPYTDRLEHACHNQNWSLVQPILSSSYLGFGNGSLERDTTELTELLSFLQTYRGAHQYVLVGHSTGCQNAVHYLKHGKYKESIRGVVLQAPVSDREHAMMESEHYKKYLEVAQTLRDAGKAEEMMPRAALWAPITAQRYLDLNERGGADDMFSSDFSDEELAERLRHVGQTKSHVLVAFSGSDEFVPSHVDSKALTKRLVEAMNIDCKGAPVAQGLVIETANHNLAMGPKDAFAFVEKVSELLKDCIDNPLNLRYYTK
jgi:pimeloyl-ACP methyl ester carboxylesterase